MPTVDIDKDNLATTINDNPFVIIDFWAPWCGPCQSFKPVFEAIAEKHDDIVFAKVNTEEQQEIASHFQIRSIPTLMVFREQIVLYAESGALQQSVFEKLVDDAKAVDMNDVHKAIKEEEEENKEMKENKENKQQPSV